MTEKFAVSTDNPTATTELEMDWAATPQELMGAIAPAAAETGAIKRLVNTVVEAVAPYLKAADRPLMKTSRAEDIWRGEATPRFWEMDALRRAAAREKIADEAKIAKEARDEFARFSARLARVEAIAEALLVHDEDFMRPHADAVDVAARRQNRTLDRGGR